MDDLGDNGSEIQAKDDINQAKEVWYHGSVEGGIQTQTNSFTSSAVATNLNPVTSAGICEGSLVKVCKSDKGSSLLNILSIYKDLIIFKELSIDSMEGKKFNFIM